MKVLLVVTATALVAACAHREPPPTISYDTASFEPAARTAEPPRPV
ncbi:hypothetical protein [Rhodovibrio sodomensis]